MSTIPKTIFGQINFRTTVAGVGFQYLGRGKHASICNITNGKGWRFIKDDLIHLLCMCMTIGDGMGCQKLGSKVQ
jgi:hypothetical protein